MSRCSAVRLSTQLCCKCSGSYFSCGMSIFWGHYHGLWTIVVQTCFFYPLYDLFVWVQFQFRCLWHLEKFLSAYASSDLRAHLRNSFWKQTFLQHMMYTCGILTIKMLNEGLVLVLFSCCFCLHLKMFQVTTPKSVTVAAVCSKLFAIALFVVADLLPTLT